MSLKGSRRSSTCPNFNLLIPNKSESEFLDDLTKYHSKHNTKFTFLPTVLGRRFSLKNLYYAVLKNGGSKTVNEKQLWDSILDELQLPKTCSNSEIALKRIYQRYLEPFEKHQFPSLFSVLSDLDYLNSSSTSLHPTASISDFRDPELRLSMKQPGSFQENVSLHYRYGLHNIIPERRLDCGMSIDLVEQGELRLLEHSLHSGLPNEVELSLNTLLILSKGFPIQLDRCHQLLELLLGLVGVFDSSPVSYFLLHDDWRRQSNRNFLRFWDQHIKSEDGRKFLHLDIFESNDSLLDYSSIPLDEYFNLDDKDSAIDTEFHWILIVAAILRNLVQTPKNASLVASNPTALRFLLLCLHCESYQLRNYSHETFSELPFDLNNCPDRIRQIVTNLINALLVSEDRAAKLTGLRMLCRISWVYSSVTHLVPSLSDESLNSLISSCLLSDVTLLVSSLESCYQLTCHSQTMCHRLGTRLDFLDILMSFLSREAQSLGTSAIYKCTIMQGVDVSMRPSVHPSSSYSSAALMKPPNSFLIPVPPRMRPPLPQPLTAFNLPNMSSSLNGASPHLPQHSQIPIVQRCSAPIQAPAVCSSHPINVSVSSTVPPLPPLNRDNSFTRCSNSSVSPSAIPSLKQYLANNMRKQRIIEKNKQQNNCKYEDNCNDSNVSELKDNTIKSNDYAENNSIDPEISSCSLSQSQQEKHEKDSTTSNRTDTADSENSTTVDSNSKPSETEHAEVSPPPADHKITETDNVPISREVEEFNSTPIIKPENFDKSNSSVSNAKVDDSAVFKVPDPRAAPSLSVCLDKSVCQRIVEWLRQQYITSSDCNGVFRSAIVTHCQKAVGRYIPKVKNITPMELHKLVKEAFGHVDHEKALISGGNVDYLYKNVTRQNLKLNINGSDLSKRSTLRSNGNFISDRLNRNSLFRRDRVINGANRKRLRSQFSPQKYDLHECSEPKKFRLENNNYSGIRRSRPNKVLGGINGVINGIKKDVVLNGHSKSIPPNGLCNGVISGNDNLSPNKNSFKHSHVVRRPFNSTHKAARLIARRSRPFNKRIQQSVNLRSSTSPIKPINSMLPGAQFFCEWHHCTSSFASQKEVFNHVYSTHLMPLKSLCLNTRQLLVCQWANCDQATMPRGVFSLIGHVTESHCTEKALLNALNRKNFPRLYPPTRQMPNYVLNDSAWSAVRRTILHEMPQSTSFIPMKEGPVTKHMRLTAALIIKNVVKHSEMARNFIRYHEAHILDLIMSGLDCSKILVDCLYDCEQNSLNDTSECDLPPATPLAYPVKERIKEILSLSSVDLDN